MDINTLIKDNPAVIQYGLIIMEDQLTKVVVDMYEQMGGKELTTIDYDILTQHLLKKLLRRSRITA